MFQFDVKAESFRGAEVKYLGLAKDLDSKAKEYHDKKVTEEQMITYISEKYDFILSTQGEMKYFPPVSKVKEWKDKQRLNDIPHEKEIPHEEETDPAVEKKEGGFFCPNADHDPHPYPKIPSLMDRVSCAATGSSDDGASVSGEVGDVGEGGGEVPCWKKAFGMQHGGTGASTQLDAAPSQGGASSEGGKFAQKTWLLLFTWWPQRL